MIGIIGFGRFGRLMAGYLVKDFKVFVYNKGNNEEKIKKTGAFPASLEEVCRQRSVILSVPISVFEEHLKMIAPLLKKDTLVADVCSVKSYPVQWMKQHLPKHVSILATHPMFGPDSAKNSLLDRKIVLCKERIDEARYGRVRAYLEKKGLNVIETTAEEHDRQIAVSLSLTHFIGRSLEEFGAKELIVDTEGYKRLLHILGVVTHDTWQLFQDMHYYNPYAKEKRLAFIEAMKKTEERLSS
ncbi:Prephenate dehydrogenase [Desulfonema limicola]|uniref:Prephenate dehydrogenase n=1 Tax=Desulfonema limicola TaxID=45656 RepID=A0A975BA29_9BACT|nr:prephenate dehydrogenase/arogenate dehydrogenase family protein [Desulfonema limicola]QTA81459.1 Prephenate dehydrogenase [Desulfonema limicola]